MLVIKPFFISRIWVQVRLQGAIRAVKGNTFIYLHAINFLSRKQMKHLIMKWNKCEVICLYVKVQVHNKRDKRKEKKERVKEKKKRAKEKQYNLLIKKRFNDSREKENDFQYVLLSQFVIIKDNINIVNEFIVKVHQRPPLTLNFFKTSIRCCLTEYLFSLTKDLFIIYCVQ